MSQSRAPHTNANDELDHLEVTNEVLAADAANAQDSLPPPSPHRHSRRVSINSLGSNASNSTVRYHPSESAPHPSQSATAPSGASGGPRMSSSSSYVGTPKLRPKPSFRSSTFLSDSPSGSRRRRPHHNKRPESGRSSIKDRNRSSDDDNDDDDDDDDDDEYDHAHHTHHGEADDYFDARSNHSRHRPSISKRSTRLMTPGDHHRSGEDYDEEEEGSDVEPLTLKDRQEVNNKETTTSFLHSTRHAWLWWC